MHNQQPCDDAKSKAEDNSQAAPPQIHETRTTPDHNEQRDTKNSGGVSEQAIVGLTRALVWWTAVLAVATIALGAIAYLQFLELRSTDGTTKQALIAVQRAFVFFTETNWEPISDKKRIQGWSAGVTMENSGNTPTRNLTIEVFCPFTQKLVPDPYVMWDKDTAVVTRRLLGPKQTTGAAICVFSVDDLASIDIDKRILYIAGKARYQDVFGEAHVTEYCLEILGFQGSPKTDPTIFPINRPCQTHNCADDDCKKAD